MQPLHSNSHLNPFCILLFYMGFTPNRAWPVALTIQPIFYNKYISSACFMVVRMTSVVRLGGQAKSNVAVQDFGMPVTA